jgi:integrase/recombinase XerD
LFSFAVKTGYLPANPAALVKSLKPKDALNERILSEGEVRGLIKGAKNERGAAAFAERNRLIIVLLYVLGLRVSELVGLNWGDFKPTQDGVLVTVLGKGSKTRTLVLEQGLFQELLKLPRSEKTEAVFLSRFGNRLDRHGIHRLVKEAAERAGINPHTSAHWLRHAHASHSLKHGAGIDLLMKSLGHSSLSTTSRYLHCQVGECTSKFIELE